LEKYLNKNYQNKYMGKMIFITGISGSGKSTLSKELKRTGHLAYDIETIPGLYSHVNKKTGSTKDKENHNLNYSKSHSWICDKKKLKKILKSNEEDAFYCGTASNLDEILPLFDKVFVLRANKIKLRDRLARRRNNHFAHEKDVREWVLKNKRKSEKHLIKEGAIPINASRPLCEVKKEILKKSSL
jgi:broad-specificity NMP kinase